MAADLWAALAGVMDPEMPVNIVDLGLVYEARLEGNEAKVKMTLTAMGCPGLDFLLEDIRQRLLELDGVQTVDVELVWSPPWTAARLSEAGRDALEAWGLAI